MVHPKSINLNKDLNSTKLPPMAAGEVGRSSSLQALSILLMQVKSLALGVEEISSLAQASLESWNIYFKELCKGKSLDQAGVTSNKSLFTKVEKLREHYGKNSVLGSDDQIAEKSDWGLVGLSVGLLPDAISTPIVMALNISATESCRVVVNYCQGTNLSFSQYLKQEEEDSFLRGLKVLRNIAILGILGGYGKALILPASMSALSVIGEKLISIGNKESQNISNKDIYQLRDFIYQVLSGQIAEEILQSMVSSRGFCMFSGLALGRAATGIYDGVDSLKDLLQAGVRGEEVGYGKGIIDSLTIIRAIGQGCLVTAAMMDIIDPNDVVARKKVVEAGVKLNSVLCPENNIAQKMHKNLRPSANLNLYGLDIKGVISSDQKHYYIENIKDVSRLYVIYAHRRLTEQGYSEEQILHLMKEIVPFAKNCDSFTDRTTGVVIAARVTNYKNTDERLFYASNLYHEEGHLNETILRLPDNSYSRDAELLSEYRQYQRQESFLEQRRKYFSNPNITFPISKRDIANDYQVALGLGLAASRARNIMLPDIGLALGTLEETVLPDDLKSTPQSRPSFGPQIALDALRNIGTERIRNMSIEDFIREFAKLTGLNICLMTHADRIILRERYEEQLEFPFEDVSRMAASRYPEGSIDLASIILGIRRDHIDPLLSNSNAVLLPLGINTMTMARGRSPESKQKREAINDYESEIAKLYQRCGIADPYSPNNIIINMDLMLRKHMWTKPVVLLILAQGLSQLYGEINSDYEYNYRLSGVWGIKFELLLAYIIGDLDYVEETIHLQRELHSGLLRRYDGEQHTIALENIYRSAQSGELFTEFGLSVVRDGKAFAWSKYWENVETGSNQDTNSLSEKLLSAESLIREQLANQGRANVLIVGGSEDGAEVTLLQKRFSKEVGVAFSFSSRAPDSLQAATILRQNVEALNCNYLRPAPELLTRHDFSGDLPDVIVVFHSLEHLPLWETTSSLRHLMHDGTRMLWVFPFLDDIDIQEKRKTLLVLKSNVELAQAAISYLSREQPDTAAFENNIAQIERSMATAELPVEGIEVFKKQILSIPGEKKEQERKRLELDLVNRLKPRLDAFYERYKPALPYGDIFTSSPLALQKFYQACGFKVIEMKEAKSNSFFEILLEANFSLPKATRAEVLVDRGIGVNSDTEAVVPLHAIFREKLEQLWPEFKFGIEAEYFGEWAICNDASNYGVFLAQYYLGNQLYAAIPQISNVLVEDLNSEATAYGISGFRGLNFWHLVNFIRDLEGNTFLVDLSFKQFKSDYSFICTPIDLDIYQRTPNGDILIPIIDYSRAAGGEGNKVVFYYVYNPNNTVFYPISELVNRINRCNPNFEWATAGIIRNVERQLQ